MVSRDDHIARNRAGWGTEAKDYVAAGERGWAGEPAWGIWQLPEAELGLLPDDLTGLDALELGCGTGYVSAWLERQGAWVVGIDPTPEQLETAARLRARHSSSVQFIEAVGERLPFADNAFDFAISEYGAVLWADPCIWVPECARVLRTGGRLVVLTNSPLVVMCSEDYEADGAATAQLKRPYFGMGRTEWSDDTKVEFHLTHGAWIDLFAEHGFRVERLAELRAPEDAVTRYGFVDAEWASQWPSEDVWIVRLMP